MLALEHKDLALFHSLLQTSVHNPQESGGHSLETTGMGEGNGFGAYFESCCSASDLLPPGGESSLGSPSRGSAAALLHMHSLVRIPLDGEGAAITPVPPQSPRNPAPGGHLALSAWFVAQH